MKNRPQRGRTKTNLSRDYKNMRPLRGRNSECKHIFNKHATPQGSVNTKLYKCLKHICSEEENYDLKVKLGLGMGAKSPEARNE